jgi:alpha-L-fucosidase
MVKAIAVFGLVLALIVISLSVPDNNESPLEHEDTSAWFEDAKFGIFIHWGLYSSVGRGEWLMVWEKIPISEYEKLTLQFDPVEFDPKEWMTLVKDSGAKYITITAKHHDGFCMWDSNVTDYDSMDRMGRDFMAEIAEAAHAKQIKLFFYYSLADWHHPAYENNWTEYVSYYQAQVQELFSNYGQIAGIWFDGWLQKPDANWKLEETYQMIHRIQPWTLIGNNHHHEPLPGEGFQIFERKLMPLQRSCEALPAEACETINNSWGYNAADDNYKSAQDLISLLVEIVGRGGNLMLNIGPRGDGTIPLEQAERLRVVGKWLKKNGEAIYGTRPGPLPPEDWGYAVQKDRRIYLHILDWLGTMMKLEGLLVNDITSVHCLNVAELDIQESRGDCIISLPESIRDEVDTVVVLDLRE